MRSSVRGYISGSESLGLSVCDALILSGDPLPHRRPALFPIRVPLSPPSYSAVSNTVLFLMDPRNHTVVNIDPSDSTMVNTGISRATVSKSVLGDNRAC